MKIALIYDQIYPYSIGGVEWRNFDLAKHLVLKGHEVHVFGTKRWRGKKTKKVSKSFFIHGVSRYSTKFNQTYRRKFYEPLFFSVKLFFELMKHDFDVVDVTSFPYFPVFSAWLYCKLKRKKLVITWHEVWDKYWKEFGIVGFFGRVIERISAKLTKNNIAVSKLTKRRLQKIGSKQVTLIENWVDAEEIKKVKKQKMSYEIISIGRHMHHKNFDFLIKCIAILKKRKPGIKCLILGHGPDTLNLLKLRDGLGLQKNVDIFSFASDKKTMLNYIAKSKVFVLLSEIEGFSITAHEAMALGVPVVTLNSTMNALKEYVPKENVVVKSEIEVIDAIERNLKKMHKPKNVLKITKQMNKLVGVYGF